ncbi:alkaline phosphatase family protein [Candidatus Bipolaricaulota bacterium]|nr:alkaline phosphatase family protein [Candidatus Bipolaricaulota bacterium]
MSRLALIGLDCADPDLLRDLLPQLPTLSALVEEGSFGRLRSVDPPITIPAWMSMMTGVDPGKFGVYGFRNRADYSYTGLRIATSAAFRAETVWDVLGRHGLRSILLGIPGTYPPKPVRGLLVSGFLAPGTDSGYTYPAALRDEISRAVGEYILDVRGFRTDDKPWLIEELRRMTERRFALARHLVTHHDWDFFGMVEIGTDRIHHGLWSHYDKAHRKYDPTSPFHDAIPAYYRLIDSEIARLLDAMPADTRVLIVSDHGAQRMEGGIGINEWLIQEGYLTLRDYPDKPTRMGELIEAGLVDWSRTVAWGEGGYYGRVFLNVAGREPEGIVPPGDYDRVRAELAAAIAAIPDEDEKPIGTRVLRPEELYSEVNGIPPDLFVYFGDLRWRSIGTIGWNRIHFHENDTGPDDANHAPYGILISRPGDTKTGRSLLEIKGMILEHFGLKEEE